MRALLFLIASACILVLYQNCGKSFTTAMQSRMIADDNSNLNNADPGAPVIVLNSAPSAISNKTDVNVTYSISTSKGGVVSSVKCQLDELPEVDCAKGFLKSGLSQGSHRLRIIATSTQELFKELIVDWIVDSMFPSITLTQSPPSVVGSKDLTVLFIAIDNSSGIESVSCVFDNKPVSCLLDASSGQYKVVLNDLTAGSKLLKIKVVDKAQNIANLEKAFEVNFSAPSVKITSSPPSLTNQPNASFTYTGMAAGVNLTKFECSRDSGVSYVACDSGTMNYSDIAEGKQSFMVRSIDNSGKKSSPASYNWVIDRKPPANPAIVSVSSTNQATMSISFSSSDPISAQVSSGVDPNSGFTCSFNGKSLASCVSPLPLTLLQNQSNTFQVLAKDRAGNYSGLTQKVVIHDNAAPIVAFTQSPQVSTTEKNATFAFSINETVKSKVCSLDDIVQSTCDSPVSFSNLDIRSHTFKVVATDAVGNVGQATFTWQVKEDVAPVALAPTYNRISVSQFGTVCKISSSGSVLCSANGVVKDLGLQDVKSISSGSTHHCALLVSGRVQCWGTNGSGELGNDIAGSYSDVPVTVRGIRTAIDIVASGNFSCALLQSGSARCWGFNHNNELGNTGISYKENSPVPVDVAGVEGGLLIEGSAGGTCVALPNNNYKCWGYTPLQVNSSLANAGNISQLSLGWYHGCVVTSSGGVRCFGIQGDGRIGNGSDLASSESAAVVGLSSGVKKVKVAGSSCAITSNGGVKCWGPNDYGSLGNGTNIRSLVPVDVLNVTDAVDLAMNGHRACVLLKSGGVKCWGGSIEANTPQDIPGF